MLCLAGWSGDPRRRHDLKQSSGGQVSWEVLWSRKGSEKATPLKFAWKGFFTRAICSTSTRNFGEKEGHWVCGP